MQCLIKTKPASSIAIQTVSEKITYGELDKQIDEKCNELFGKSSMTLHAHFSFQTVITFFAALRLNMSIALLSPHSKKNSFEHPQKPLIHFQTSGSSGEPQWISLTQENLVKNALGVIDYFQTDKSTKWHLCLPLFHVGGLSILWRQFLMGGCVTWGSVDDMLHLKPNIVSLVPTQLQRLIDQNKALSNIQYMVGGAATSPHLIKKCRKLKLQLHLTYGMTEMASTISIGLYNLGKPLRYRQLKIGDDGTIFVRGDVCAKSSSWFETRDLGTWDENGNLVLLGRKGRMIIKGGENIPIHQIEEALFSIEKVNEARVIGMKDKEYGEIPVAFVSMKNFDALFIHDQLKNLIPKFFLPHKILPLPKTQGLKVDVSTLVAKAQEFL